MIWLNISTPLLRSPSFIGSDPIARATWLYVVAYACEQENGGVILGCKSWKDRQWQQTCGVTMDEINQSFPLLSWVGEDLVIFGYPKEKEAEVKAKREAGSKGGKTARANDKGRISSITVEVNPSSASSSASSTPLSIPSRSASTERKGKEEKGMEGNGIEHLPVVPTGVSQIKLRIRLMDQQAEEIYEAYPRKIAKSVALRAIKRALSKISFEELLKATKGYAVSRSGEDSNFTPYPATWFNREQFRDDPSSWSAAKPKQSNAVNNADYSQRKI